MNLCSIKSIVELEEQEVWDIAVNEMDLFENEPNFIAQDILLHNCHAAGICLSPVPLSTIAPLHITKAKNENETSEGEDDRILVTQFTNPDLEKLGLIKFDILGVSTKTAIHLACRYIKEEKGVDIELGKMPLDDKETLELLSSGLTDTCFQLENRGMKDTLRLIGIDSFDDLVAVIAMYRPGPMQYIPDYAGRKQGKVSISYAHPLLEKITKKTYGIICFQEQLMQAFVELAGMSAADGYKFLKGCAKKDMKLIDSFQEKFAIGCRKKNISDQVIDRIYNDLKRFGGYAFNKSHSASYAYESFKTAYLKAHYPTEWLAARLTVETKRKKFDEVEKYLQDAVKNFGFEILEPTLNDSKLHWAIAGHKKLRMSLLFKGIGMKAAEEIVKHQPYKGNDILFDFAMKVGKTVNSKVLISMKQAGFWKGIKEDKLIQNFEQIKADRKKLLGRPPAEAMFA